jgi:hypothetical protein
VIMSTTGQDSARQRVTDGHVSAAEMTLMHCDQLTRQARRPVSDRSHIITPDCATWLPSIATSPRPPTAWAHVAISFSSRATGSVGSVPKPIWPNEWTTNEMARQDARLLATAQWRRCRRGHPIGSVPRWPDKTFVRRDAVGTKKKRHVSCFVNVVNCDVWKVGRARGALEWSSEHQDRGSRGVYLIVAVYLFLVDLLDSS